MEKLIKGNRGKIGKGYTLKDTNKCGTYYVYVWYFGVNKEARYNATEVKNKRERKRENGEEYTNYSKVNGWHSLGKMNDPETIEKLREHITKVYGGEFDLIEVREYLYQLRNEMEKKRLFLIEILTEELKTILKEKGLFMEKIPTSVAGLKRVIKKLQ